MIIKRNGSKLFVWSTPASSVLSTVSPLAVVIAKFLYSIGSVFLLLSLISLLLGGRSAEAQVAFQFAFGSNGSDQGQFSNPSGIAIDPTGNVYVTDVGNNRIQVFDSLGNFQFAFGSNGSGGGQFADPWGVTLDHAGNVYVADSSNNRIQILDSSGNFQFAFGTSGTGNGEFDAPLGVAIDDNNKIYVADTFNHRVQVFDSNANFQFTFGVQGSADGQFQQPAYLTLDGAGKIYVPDQNNDRVQVFDNDGNFLFTFGQSGTGDGQFDDPTDVEIDSHGNIFVADSDNNRVQVFDDNANFLFLFGSTGTGDGQFNNAPGIAINEELGYIYVTDFNDRVQVFQLISNSTTVVPDSFLVNRGTYVSGGVIELAESDNVDLSIQRSNADIQSRTEFEVKAISPTASPSSLEVTLEGSVFARSQVNQTIELRDYVAGQWEPVDTRAATRFSDSTVTVAATGDLSRFVEAGTMCMKARIRYQSPLARQKFSSNTDQFIWTVGQ